MGETQGPVHRPRFPRLLSVSSNGSEWVKPRCGGGVDSAFLSFSILKRIGVGETRLGGCGAFRGSQLSVSSNGSEWVKHHNGVVGGASN